ncbi:putative serine racemase [Gonapodya prolifera JEL478]|uniref:Serine racemase n=1 Tax=Gonapodya prolifera (strain JEL478) TaxID=1344416 RepID=A0A139B0H7_GONPJ|nr:putative serine racemase [Gonapodya prolifera JEL478]|eukprot:KXS22501.1 putative serine racemase [Gonapodya prolifera JEL478]
MLTSSKRINPTRDPPLAISFEDIRKAHDRIRSYVHRTPVVISQTIDAIASRPLDDEDEAISRRIFIKCENQQKIGAFKIRGATNAVRTLIEREEAPRAKEERLNGDAEGAGIKNVRDGGVVTHSSGNHGQALALAAKTAGIPCTVVVPKGAPPPKVSAMSGYGATIVKCENNQKSREAECQAVVESTGAVLIHPYNEPLVMAGQGTLAIELLEQSKEDYGVDLDAIVVAVGGGGMLSGCTVAAKSFREGIHVFAAEPAGADDAYRSFKGNKWTGFAAGQPNTVADGLRTTTGSLTWEIIHELVDDVFTVEDEQIIHTMKMVFERMKQVVEPSAVVTLAVVLFNKEFRKAARGMKNIGVVFSGGNVDLDSLPWVKK